MNIAEKIKDFDGYAIQKLHQFISLIMLVDRNYYHIQELETVKDLLDKYNSSYYNEYYPNIPIAASIAVEIADTTRAAHYDDKHKSSDYFLDNVINADLHPMLTFKYEKDTQARFDKYHEIGERASY